MTACVVGEVLHLQKTDLVETTSKDIDNVTIVGSTLGEAVIELGNCQQENPKNRHAFTTYLNGLLVVLDVIAVNVVVGTNGLLQFRRDDKTGALSSRTTSEVHNTASGILEGGFQQSNGHTQSHTCATQSTLVVRHGPRVTLQLLEDIGDLELSLLDGQKEAGGRAKGCAGWLLLRGHAGAEARSQAEHFLNLLGIVILVTPENVGLGAFGVAELVHLGLQMTVNYQTIPQTGEYPRTIVP